MTDHEPATPDRDDWRDRLVDAGLCELAGGPRPPDLSEQILAAAAGTPAPQAAVTLAGSETMSETSVPRPSSRFGWKTWAVAASLLVAAGALFVPQVRGVMEAARREKLEDQVRVRGVTSKPRVDAATSTDATQPNQYRNLNSFLSERTAKRGKKDEGAKPVSRKSDGLMMAVTPHIIIQEEEEERLGIAPEADAEPAEGAGSQEASDGQAAAVEGGRRLHFGRGRLPPDVKQIVGNGANAAWQMGYQGSSGKLNVNAHDTYGYYGGRPFLGDAKGQPSQTLDVFAEGQGPGLGGDQYARIFDNPFVPVSIANTDHRLSTFSIDIDTASYANVRQFIMQSGMLPPPDAVRIEELVNYFDYDYSPPTDDAPFAANVEVSQCPWQPDHRLVRIGIKGREMDRRARPQSNLVFLIDVSGSMNEPAKLPLLLEGMRMLTRELGENDRVAIVVYASSEGLALDSTPGTDQAKIMASLDQLRAGGSTAGGAGIQLAYQKATEHFIKGGVNRVILCTDGDFNVGVTSPAELERMAEEQAKETGVFLTVLGFGRGNLNDAMMEQISGKGNGNYHYVDTQQEARKVLVEEMAGTLVTIAKDVKIQVEFNPAKVAGYRLIGYENRVLAAEDFNDDKKDAGEIGAGHTVTALYEVVPAGMKVESAEVDDLKYGEAASAAGGATKDSDDAKPASGELLTVKIRYKLPDGDKSTKLEFPVADSVDGETDKLVRRSVDFQFAAAVASFGMILRDSPYKGNATFASVAEIAQGALGDSDPHGYRQEFVEIINRAKEIAGK
jgi:Ca-activated chloride channel family protein